jgi:hypothetical protein
MVEIINAIQALDPNAWVGVSNNDINKIHWHDGNPNKITEEQILAKQKELQADYDAKQYQRDRLKEYNAIGLGEQLDMIYHDMDGWKAKIKAVKDKYPKPT